MTITEHSGPIRDLIVRIIDSVETLELLALLHRSADTFWAPEAAAERLGIPSDLAQKKMNALADAALLSRAHATGAFRYAPADESIRSVVSGLVDAYVTQRMSVVNAIDSANIDRLRALTDAFKLRKT